MKLTDLKTSGHAPTLISAFLHFDVSFMVWVILGALAPFFTADPVLTGPNLQITPLASIQRDGQFTLIVKGADPAKGQTSNLYNLLLKAGAPAEATKASVKPVEAFVLDNANPATIARLNATSRLIHLSVSSAARGNPNESILALKPAAELKGGVQPVANGYPASVKLTLIGIPLLAAAFWRILLGILADRFGAKRVGVASLIVTLVPLLLAWQLADSYGALVCVGFFLGVSGASFAVALPIASRWYPPEMQGIAMGIAGAGNSGTVMATLFAPMLAKTYGWHAVFGLLTIPVTITLIAFAFLAKEPPARSKPVEARDFFAVVGSKDLWAFSFLYFVTFGGFVGLSSFLNTFFVDQFDAPKAAVGLWTWPFIVVGSLLRPFGGMFADKVGGVRMLSALFASIALCAAIVGFSMASYAPAVVFLFLTMGALGMGNGCVFQLVPQRFKKEIGIVTGLVGAAGGIGGYYLNFALGHLHDLTGSYACGFWALGGIAVLALVALRAIAPGWVGVWLAAGGQARTTADASSGAIEVHGGTSATIGDASPSGATI